MKRKNLEILDVILITIIMLGPAIFKSTQMFLSGPAQTEGIIFSTYDNIRAIIIQSIQFIIAFVYLWFRKFDFSNWKYKVTVKDTFLGIGLFFILGFLVDLTTIVTSGAEWIPGFLSSNIPVLSALSVVTPSVVLFSILNGFYEEIFFLGVCTSVKKEQQKGVFIYSLIIRIAFHTYQGIISALAIGLILGIIYYVLYKKKTSNLYPYMLSHTFADIFGLSLLHFL